MKTILIATSIILALFFAIVLIQYNKSQRKPLPGNYIGSMLNITDSILFDVHITSWGQIMMRNMVFDISYDGYARIAYMRPIINDDNTLWYGDFVFIEDSLAGTLYEVTCFCPPNGKSELLTSKIPFNAKKINP